MAELPKPPPPSRSMTSRAFWQWVDRLQIPDADALALIGYPGKIGPSGKRPRFRLTTRQARLARYLPEIEAALRAAGQAPAWLQRRNRAVPFSGRAPVELMAEREGEGAAEVLQSLNPGGAAEVAAMKLHIARQLPMMAAAEQP
jgi:hypothetical protein